jgi:hypothetical protein
MEGVCERLVRLVALPATLLIACVDCQYCVLVFIDRWSTPERVESSVHR